MKYDYLLNIELTLNLLSFRKYLLYAAHNLKLESSIKLLQNVWISVYIR